METILAFDHVSYFYQDGSQQVLIFDDASYTFEKGKLYAIVGASGSGKTTSIVLAGGLDKPKEGQVTFQGQSLKSIGFPVYRQKYVSIVFQAYNLISYMNACQNVVCAMDIAKQNPADKKGRALEILSGLGLKPEECVRDISKLSGGQQQRVAIARAIAKDAELILADDPTGNLDSRSASSIVDLFLKLAHEQHKCVIIVTHAKEVADRCDVQLSIKDGKLLET